MRSCSREGRARLGVTMSSPFAGLLARFVRLLRIRKIIRLTPFDTGTAEGRSNERFRRASLSAATSAGAKGIALFTTAVSVPLTLGYLGSERFGVWMTLSALIALLGFTDLGIGNSLLNSVAHAAGRDDRLQIRASVSSGITMISSELLKPEAPFDLNTPTISNGMLLILIDRPTGLRPPNKSFAVCDPMTATRAILARSCWVMNRPFSIS